MSLIRTVYAWLELASVDVHHSQLTAGAPVKVASEEKLEYFVASSFNSSVEGKYQSLPPYACAYAAAEFVASLFPWAMIATVFL